MEISEKANTGEIQKLIQRLQWAGLQVCHANEGTKHRLAIIGQNMSELDLQQISTMPIVEKVLPSKQPYKLAGSEFKKSRTVINVKGRMIGAGHLTVIAGPCSVESKEQIRLSAQIVAQAGATFLRGGAFKPRTSPYSFQGLGEDGLMLLQNAADDYGLLSISEVMDTSDIELVAQYVDILQIGARNMQNFSLLKKLGKVGKPILLKRGMSATYKDLLMSAEYILNAGNEKVILCERGIRTFEDYARNTFDVAAVPILRELSHLPVFADPSHGTGLRKMVCPMACAAVAADDGLMIEVHPNPDQALSDAEQTIGPVDFGHLMDCIGKVKDTVDRFS